MAGKHMKEAYRQSLEKYELKPQQNTTTQTQYWL